MELYSEGNGWGLRMEDALVEALQIDFRLGLRVADKDGNAQIYIGGPCTLRGPNANVACLTPGDAASLAPALSLFNTQVLEVSIAKTGDLRIRFAGGLVLVAGPYGPYEPWEMSILSAGSANYMLVCAPDGEVSVFSGQPVSPRQKEGIAEDNSGE